MQLYFPCFYLSDFPESDSSSLVNFFQAVSDLTTRPLVIALDVHDNFLTKLKLLVSLLNARVSIKYYVICVEDPPRYLTTVKDLELELSVQLSRDELDRAEKSKLFSEALKQYEGSDEGVFKQRVKEYFDHAKKHPSDASIFAMLLQLHTSSTGITFPNRFVVSRLNQLIEQRRVDDLRLLRFVALAYRFGAARLPFTLCNEICSKMHRNTRELLRIYSPSLLRDEDEVYQGSRFPKENSFMHPLVCQIVLTHMSISANLNDSLVDSAHFDPRFEPTPNQYHKLALDFAECLRCSLATSDSIQLIIVSVFMHHLWKDQLALTHTEFWLELATIFEKPNSLPSAKRILANFYANFALYLMGTGIRYEGSYESRVLGIITPLSLIEKARDLNLDDVIRHIHGSLYSIEALHPEPASSRAEKIASILTNAHLSCQMFKDISNKNERGIEGQLKLLVRLVQLLNSLFKHTSWLETLDTLRSDEEVDLSNYDFDVGLVVTETLSLFDRHPFPRAIRALEGDFYDALGQSSIAFDRLYTFTRQSNGSPGESPEERSLRNFSNAIGVKLLVGPLRLIEYLQPDEENEWQLVSALSQAAQYCDNVLPLEFYIRSLRLPFLARVPTLVGMMETLTKWKGEHQSKIEVINFYRNVLSFLSSWKGYDHNIVAFHQMAFPLPRKEWWTYSGAREFAVGPKDDKWMNNLCHVRVLLRSLSPQVKAKQINSYLLKSHASTLTKFNASIHCSFSFFFSTSSLFPHSFHIFFFLLIQAYKNAGEGKLLLEHPPILVFFRPELLKKKFRNRLHSGLPADSIKCTCSLSFGVKGITAWVLLPSHSFTLKPRLLLSEIKMIRLFPLDLSMSSQPHIKALFQQERTHVSLAFLFGFLLLTLLT